MKQFRRAVAKNSARSKIFLFAFSSAFIVNTVPIAVQRCGLALLGDLQL